MKPHHFFHPHKAYCKSVNKHIQNPFAWQDGKISIIPQATIEELNEQIFISAIETAENRPEVIIIGTGEKQKISASQNCCSLISLQNRLRMHEHSLRLPNFSFTARRRTKHMGLVVAIICRKDYCIMLV